VSDVQTWWCHTSLNACPHRLGGSGTHLRLGDPSGVGLTGVSGSGVSLGVGPGVGPGSSGVGIGGPGACGLGGPGVGPGVGLGSSGVGLGPWLPGVGLGGAGGPLQESPL